MIVRSLLSRDLLKSSKKLNFPLLILPSFYGSLTSETGIVEKSALSLLKIS